MLAKLVAYFSNRRPQRPQRSPRLQLEALESRLALSDFYYYGMGNDSNWTTVANWSTTANSYTAATTYPGNGTTGTDTAHFDSNWTNNSVNLNTSVNLAGVIDSSNVININQGNATLTLSGGTSALGGTGQILVSGGSSVTVTGTLQWSGGTISLPNASATGTLIVGNGGTVTQSGTVTLGCNLDINHYGEFVMSGGTIQSNYVRDPADLTNPSAAAVYNQGWITISGGTTFQKGPNGNNITIVNDTTGMVDCNNPDKTDFQSASMYNSGTLWLEGRCILSFDQLSSLVPWNIYQTGSGAKLTMEVGTILEAPNYSAVYIGGGTTLECDGVGTSTTGWIIDASHTGETSWGVVKVAGTLIVGGNGGYGRLGLSQAVLDLFGTTNLSYDKTASVGSSIDATGGRNQTNVSVILEKGCTLLAWYNEGPPAVNTVWTYFIANYGLNNLNNTNPAPPLWSAAIDTLVGTSYYDLTYQGPPPGGQ